MTPTTRKMESKLTLVTGGAGFIGSHLVDVLSQGRVRVFDDFSTGNVGNLAHLANHAHVEIVEGDIRDQSAVNRSMEGVHVVFHLACRGVRHSIGHPGENHEVNASGTLSVLEAAFRAGVERFVHVSSSEVYGTARQVPMDEQHPCRPCTVYGAAKLAGEAYARAYHQTYGLETVVVRPFNNFGPRSHFEGDSGEVIPRFIVQALNSRPPIIFGDGTQTRDFVFVEETAHWLVSIMHCNELVGQTVNLGSGVETSILQLSAIIGEEVGCPDWEPEFRASRPGDVQRHCAETRLARETLGWNARTSVRDGIRRCISYFRQSSRSPADLLAEMDDTNWTTSSTTP